MKLSLPTTSRILFISLTIFSFGLVMVLIGLAPLEEPVPAPPVERKMRLLVSPARLHKPFVATLYCKGAMAGEVVWLELPPGVQLLPGDIDWRVVPPPGEYDYSSVTWKVQATHPGRFDFTAHAAGMLTSSQTVNLYGWKWE